MHPQRKSLPKSATNKSEESEQGRLAKPSNTG